LRLGRWGCSEPHRCARSSSGRTWMKLIPTGAKSDYGRCWPNQRREEFVSRSDSKTGPVGILTQHDMGEHVQLTGVKGETWTFGPGARWCPYRWVRTLSGVFCGSQGVSCTRLDLENIQPHSATEDRMLILRSMGRGCPSASSWSASSRTGP